MKILAVNNVFIQNTISSSKRNRFYLGNDTISFSGKVNINYEMQNLPSEAFPSDSLRKIILQGITSNPNADVVELHKEYYSDLLDCKTLDEAKDCYPEFAKVVDAKDLDLSKKPPNNVFCQIQKGNIEGFDIENVSLMLLKKYYGELIPINVEYIKENVGVSYSAYKTLIETLNISMDKRYFKLLGLKMRASNMQSAWETDSMRVKRAETLKKTVSTPEYKQKASLASKKRWQDIEYRENLTAKIRESRRSPEARKKTAEITRKLWQDEEYQKKMKINNQASAMAWDMHPYAKAVYKEIAHEFPELRSALECRRKNEPLTDRQVRVLSQYYKTCEERYPNLRREVSAIHKGLLGQWGYYDKNRTVDEILSFIESLNQ